MGIELTRRTALQGLAGLVIGVHLTRGARAQATPGAAFAPNAFVRVAPDSTITVLIKHIEFGQGPFTGLTTLVAEEMDADWAQMRAEHAPSNTELYKNLFFGAQGTGGSTAMANSFEQMRKAGAAARALLVAAAAQSWGVPAGEITVEAGVLRHAATKREGRFGDFAEAAAKLPLPADVPLKDPKNFKLIGTDRGPVKRLDSAAKATGKALFTIDVQEAGMLTVLVAHPPLFGAKVASFDAAKARAVPGVVDVKQLSSGIAVYAKGFWPARQARDLLEIKWDETGAEKRGTAQLVEEYRALAATPGAVAGTHGDAAKALAGAR
ncbi:molybdopterin cofactor-binding domain-containing protein [Oleomonas cavernae]|uniref:molybdopterin cofactor-binding domain-containing protein n=1 Tax=Oleomonas cavernae TaxID=2320859 RepID=UPI001F329023|nr:molybdopterin cofactor-binding domain-containing protein [Oleomonas cavernae]